MGIRLFIGNLSPKVNETELYALFGTAGTVMSVIVATDHQTGARKNYGFVEMESEEEAKAAVETLTGHSMAGRAIKVTEIQPPVARNSMHSTSGGFRQTRGGWGSRSISKPKADDQGSSQPAESGA
jgi:RNA recognition motif-containing protein